MNTSPGVFSCNFFRYERIVLGGLQKNFNIGFKKSAQEKTSAEGDVFAVSGQLI
jgi:hypothetical protein